jgi:hypothetical protein
VNFQQTKGTIREKVMRKFGRGVPANFCCKVIPIVVFAHIVVTLSMEVNLQHLRVTELKQQLKNLGLSTTGEKCVIMIVRTSTHVLTESLPLPLCTGKKEILINRLKEATKQSAAKDAPQQIPAVVTGNKRGASEMMVAEVCVC